MKYNKNVLPAFRSKRRQNPVNSKNPHPVDLEVGERLKYFRLKQGFTLAIVAEHLNITCQHLHKCELGETRLSASRLYDASLVLGVKPEDFFEGMKAALSDLPLARTLPRQPERERRRAGRIASNFSAIDNEETKAALEKFVRGLRQLENRSKVGKGPSEQQT